jgi:hypothetical protein
MNKAIIPGRFLLILLSACLISYYLLFLRQTAQFNIQNHSFDLKTAPFLLLSLFLGLFLYGAWLFFSRSAAERFSLDQAHTRDRSLWTLAPVVFLLFVPAANFFYMDRYDLSFRLQLLGIAVLVAVLYLNTINLSLWSRNSSRPLLQIFPKFAALSPRRKVILLFVISLLVYNAGSALLLHEGITLSGDEPHYLVISQSLLEDGDFDLSNNYEDRDYRKYMPPTTRLSPHTAPRTQGRHSFHSPGLSLLLLPFYSLGALFGGKLQLFCVRFGMSILGALLGLQVFLYARQEWKQEKLALGLWAIFSFTSPIYFHAIHIYPEIVVTLISLYIYRRLRFASQFSRGQLIFMGLLLACFIWLHAVKYTFILIPLFLYCIWTLLRKHRVGWNLLYFLAFPIGLTLLHMVFSHNLYGSLSIFSVSLKGATTASESTSYLKNLFSVFSLRARWETLAGYFFDQRDGLLFYAPLYFFAFLGVIEMVRHKRRDLWVLLFLSAPYVLFHAFLTQRTSFAPHARTLVAVTWVAAIFLGAFLTHCGKRYARTLFNLAVVISLILVYLLLRTPWALYQPTTAGESERAGMLFASLSHMYFYLPDYLPSYLKVYESHWIPNYAWLGALVLFLVIYIIYQGGRRLPDLRRHVVAVFLALSLLFIGFVLYPRTVLLYPVNTEYPGGQKLTFYALGRVARMTESGRFRITADKRAFVFHFTSWRKLNALELEIGSEEGDYFVAAHLFDREVFRDQISSGMKALNIAEPEFYRYKKAYLYRITLYLERRSAVSIVQSPFVFSVIPR